MGSSSLLDAISRAGDSSCTTLKMSNIFCGETVWAVNRTVVDCNGEFSFSGAGLMMEEITTVFSVCGWVSFSVWIGGTFGILKFFKASGSCDITAAGKVIDRLSFVLEIFLVLTAKVFKFTSDLAAAALRGTLCDLFSAASSCLLLEVVWGDDSVCFLDFFFFFLFFFFIL